QRFRFSTAFTSPCTSCKESGLTLATYGIFSRLLDERVPLSCLSSCLGQIVVGFLGCWRLVEGAVTQHGIEGIEASSSQSNNGLFMGFLLGTFLVVVGARGGVVGLQ